MKKVTKSLFALLMCLTMVFTIAPLSGIVPMVSAETQTTGTCGEKLNWSFDDETDVLEITGTGKMTDWTSVKDTPWYAVRSKIKTVKISNGVESVGKNAFTNASKLETVELGKDVKAIGLVAFSDCKALKSVVIPAAVTAIKERAFDNCEALETVYFEGTEKQWADVVIGANNDALAFASFEYEYHIHEYIGKVTKPATCTEKGVMTYTCDGKDCKEQTEEIPVVAHTEKTVPTTEPTCGKVGEGKVVCSDCGKEIKDKVEIPATGKHEFEPKTDAATCTEAGAKYDLCTACGAKDKVEPIPATGHDLVTKKDSDSTCAVKGSEHDECKKCDYKSAARELPLDANNHSTEKVAEAPTCEDAGYEYYVCKACGKNDIDYKEIPALGHAWTDWVVKEATNTTAGEKTRECTTCGKPEKIVIPAILAFKEMTTELKSLINTKNGPKLTWSAVEGAEGYYVYRKVGDAKWSRIGDVPETYFVDSSAKSGTEYIYTAKAYIGDDSTKFESGLTVKYLASPTVSDVSNTKSGALIKWNAVGGVSKYYIYRKTADGTYANVGNTTTTSFTDTTGVSGTKYYYTVRAAYGTTLSSYNAGKGLVYLASPVVSAVANTTTGAKVTWNAVDGATKYYVYRKTVDGTYKNVGVTTATTLTDPTAASGTKYYYTVKAVSGTTYSSYNAGKGVVYMTSPTVSSAGNTTAGVKISWGKIGGAKTYYVYRKTANGSYARVGTTTATSFTDTTAKSGTTYYYTVRAYNGSVLSSYRAGRSVKVLTAPTVAAVTARTDGVKITWGKITGASGYYVYRKTASGEYEVIGTTTSLTFTDKAAKKGTTYYYTVRAYSGSTLSSYRAGKKA